MKYFLLLASIYLISSCGSAPDFRSAGNEISDPSLQYVGVWIIDKQEFITDNRESFENIIVNEANKRNIIIPGHKLPSLVTQMASEFNIYHMKITLKSDKTATFLMEENGIEHNLTWKYVDNHIILHEPQKTITLKPHDGKLVMDLKYDYKNIAQKLKIKFGKNTNE